MAVDHVKPAVVSGGDHAVASREAALTGLELIGPEAAGVPHVFARAAVEVGDIGPAVGDHHRVLAAPVGSPPVLYKRGARLLGAGGCHNPAVVVVVAGEALDVAAPQRSERLTVPPLALTSDLVELVGAQPFGEGAERAARVDLGKLTVVADEHELGLGALSRAGELGEVTRADHPRLVDDEHRSALQFDPPVEPVSEAGDRCRVNASLIAQLARRAGRERAAEHRHAAPLPGLARAVERARLPGAGRGTDHLDSVATLRERDDKSALLLAELRACGERRVRVGRARSTRPFAAT